MNETTKIVTGTLPAPQMRVLSIDAWRDGDGWQWNNWHVVGHCEPAIADLSVRKLLRWMRAEGYLGEGSKGAVTIEDDQYNVVILDRRTLEPLYALEYGALQS